MGQELEEILSCLRERQIHDFLALQSDPSVCSLVENERIVFSDLVQKYNRYQVLQERVLVVTDTALYNFMRKKKVGKLKRRIPLSDLRALVFSKQCDEVVIQVKNDYDYRLKVIHRPSLCQSIGEYFYKNTKTHLAVYVNSEKSLKEFASSKKQFSAMTEEIRTRKSSVEALTGPLDYLIRSKAHQQAVLKESYAKKHVVKIAETCEKRQEGWLTKRKQKGTQWKLKFFMILGGDMTYFHPRLKGTIPLDDTKVEFQIGGENTPKFQLKVSSSSRKRPLIIGTDEEECKDLWAKVFSGELFPAEGWLWKQDPWKHSWARRYFNVRQHDCQWFEMDLRWAIPLTQRISVRPAKLIEPTLTDTDNSNSSSSNKESDTYPFRFSISTEERVYLLASQTEQEMLVWIQEIQQASISSHDEQVDALLESENNDKPSQLALHSVDLSNLVKAPSERVALVFTDIQGSTKLWESASEAMNEALELHDRILRQLLKSYSGYEVKTEGDAFMVAFSNSVDAVGWCIAVQRALLEAQWSPEILEVSAHEQACLFRGLCIRMGVHVGTPACKKNPVTRRMDYFGRDVNLAARVSDAAHGGQIACTMEVNRELQETLAENSWEGPELICSELKEGPFLLKGIEEPVAVFQVCEKGLSGRSFPALRAKTLSGERVDEEPDQL